MSRNDLYGTRFLTLVKLFGPEAAVKMLHLYGGCIIRIPQISGIKARVRRALIRREVIEMRKSGMLYKEIDKKLGKKYRINPRIIAYARGLPNLYGKSKERAIKAMSIEASEDYVYLELMVQHTELWKKYGVL